MIDHTPVDSSNIRSIGYDEEKQELHINFHQTGRYVYKGVSKAKYDALMESGSKGQFLNHHIKDKHGHSKL